MRWLHRIGYVPAALFISVIVLVSLYIRMTIWPEQDIVMSLPMKSVEMHIQKWNNLSGPYWLIKITTPHGSVDDGLGLDGDMFSRANFYRTPEDWLAILTSGGGASIINTTDNSGPKILDYRNLPRNNDNDWTYIGAFTTYQGLRSPSEMRECFEMLGGGSSEYRLRFQKPHHC